MYPYIGYIWLFQGLVCCGFFFVKDSRFDIIPIILVHGGGFANLYGMM